MNAALLKFGLPLAFCVVLAALCSTSLAEKHRPSPEIESQPKTLPSPPYVQRGDEVEARYRTYTGRLRAFHESLHTALTQEAPDLVNKLTPTPPKPAIYGYQIVPRLVPDTPRPEKLPRFLVTSYSWPRTEQLIDAELAKLVSLKEQLQTLSGRRLAARRPIYEQLITEYLQREAKHRLAERRLRHNRFWQRQIHPRKANYELATRLLDAVLERQEIRDTLNATLPPDNAAELKAREQALTLSINELNAPREDLRPASFLTVLHPEPQLWIVQVPLYTDIQDQQFLQAYQHAIETVWHVKDSDSEFHVQVQLRSVASEDLYAPDPAPPTGAHFDINAHAARFPADGGVLTTGGYQKYARPRRFVVLGPQDISVTVLAHEFGHILGFSDGYIRGYRDLGEDGYEVVEFVPDFADIMSAPGRGRVLRPHFDKLLATLSPAPLTGRPLLP